MKKILSLMSATVISMFIFYYNLETNAPEVLSFSKRIIQITDLNKKIRAIEIKQNILKRVSITIKLSNTPQELYNILRDNGFMKEGDAYVCDGYCITIQENVLVFSRL